MKKREDIKKRSFSTLKHLSCLSLVVESEPLCALQASRLIMNHRHEEDEDNADEEKGEDEEDGGDLCPEYLDTRETISHAFQVNLKFLRIISSHFFPFLSFNKSFVSDMCGR